MDEEGKILVNEEDRNRFGLARPGDHLFCPFQCELCHFWNLQGRSSIEGAGNLGDKELLKCLRRVNLNAFWSREPSTIYHNMGKASRALKIVHELGTRDPPLPKLGPWELKDEFGAGVAVIILTHSLDPGVMGDMVQYETVRKSKSAPVNMYDASVENKGTSISGGEDGKKLLVLGAPVYHGWYDRAQVGMHHRMGDNVVQNYGLSK
jgi:hypothetical protein